MANPVHSTIAQLLYADLPAIDFARIVAELEAMLSGQSGAPVEIEWDPDDLITFHLPEAQIVLACTEYGPKGRESCLTIAVCPLAGPADRGGHLPVLCSRLVERISQRYSPVSTLWREVAEPVTADFIDRLVDALPSLNPPLPPAMPQGLPPVEAIVDEVASVDRIKNGLPPLRMKTTIMPKAPMESLPPMESDLIPANDRPDLPRLHDDSLIPLRDALYAKGTRRASKEQPLSTQMRLTVHCLNATLILVWAPLGAAVMTYSLLRGENMRLSARLMAVVGTMMALAHTPIGHTVKAMAGV